MANRKTPTVANFGPSIPGDDYADAVNEEVAALWNRSGQWLDSVVGTNSLTATTTPTLDAYAKNQKWYLVPQNTNTGPMQINIDGKGLRDIKSATGAALVGGEFVAGAAQALVDTGTNLRMQATVIASVNAQVSIYARIVANNTAGGTATSGSRQTYPLSHTIRNDITGASLITSGGDVSKFNLPAGTFEAWASAQFFATNRSKIVLRNQTNGLDPVDQVCSECYASNVGNALLVTKFALAVPTIMILQYRVQTTRATDGLGVAGNLGEDQQLGYIMLRKVA